MLRANRARGNRGARMRALESSRCGPVGRLATTTNPGRAIMRHAHAGAAAAVAAVDFAAAYDGPVEKKVFTLPSYTTVGGKTLKDVKVGYETYGKLNAAGDNAIFVPHFFTGNFACRRQVQADRCCARLLGSDHRFRASDRHRQVFRHQRRYARQSQYQRPERHDDGPSTINPETGKPLGMSFPVVSYRDSVRVHKALRRFARREEAAGGCGPSGGRSRPWSGPPSIPISSSAWCT